MHQGILGSEVAFGSLCSAAQGALWSKHRNQLLLGTSKGDEMSENIYSECLSKAKVQYFSSSQIQEKNPSPNFSFFFSLFLYSSLQEEVFLTMKNCARISRNMRKNEQMQMWPASTLEMLTRWVLSLNAMQVHTCCDCTSAEHHPSLLLALAGSSKQIAGTPEL